MTFTFGNNINTEIQGVLSWHNTTSTRRVWKTCIAPKKRLLKEEYAIHFPVAKKPSQELFPSVSSGWFTSSQEDDFKLAIQLQCEENMICEESDDNFDADREIFGIHRSSSDLEPEDNHSETENAAAALSFNNAGSK